MLDYKYVVTTVALWFTVYTPACCAVLVLVLNPG